MTLRKRLRPAPAPGTGCGAIEMQPSLATITSSGVKTPLGRGNLTPDNAGCDNSGAWCIQRENQAA